jgi:hypothetical protein
MEGGIEHLRLFKGLVQGGKELHDKLGVIWFSSVSSIWKARNNIIINLDGFHGELSGGGGVKGFSLENY